MGTIIHLELDNSQPERLDRILAKLLPGRSRSFLVKVIEGGNVRVDDEIVTKSSVVVSSGQMIDVEIPAATGQTVASQDLPLRILFEDSDIVVIDKPAGLVVHPSAGHTDATLVNALLFHVKDLSGVGGEIRPGIVHRLDKDTSGVMVIAKNDLAHRELTTAWGTDRVRKEYLALVYGKPRNPKGTIEQPIGRDPNDRKRMAVVESGRNAITDYVAVGDMPYVTLLRCSLKTGRTHQIRVHLKWLGHPIVGDPLYSGPQWRGIPDKKLQKALKSFGRQALHAERLRFPHPRTGEAMSFEAPVPEDLRELIAIVQGK